MPSQISSPTIQDIATALGISKSAVSLALNNKPGVSDKLRHQILAVAEEIGYQHEKRQPIVPFATLEKKSIFVIHQIGSDSYEDMHGLALAWLNGIRSFLRSVNANLTLVAGYRSRDIDRVAGQLFDDSENPMDGLIVMGPGVQRNSQLIQRTLDLEVPLVVIGRAWHDLTHISTVSQDYYQQARLALNYLVQLGHRQIAFVAREMDDSFDWYEIRLSCYREMMERVNGRIDDNLIITAKNAKQVVRKLQKQAPQATAVYAIHDDFAVKMIQSLEKEGIHVPQDLSVIGQDNTEEITTVGFPHADVGYQGAEILFKLIENQQTTSIKTLINCQLIVRHSCQAVAVSPAPVTQLRTDSQVDPIKGGSN